jgi:hypothetical protein
MKPMEMMLKENILDYQEEEKHDPCMVYLLWPRCFPRACPLGGRVALKAPHKGGPLTTSLKKKGQAHHVHV